MSIQSHISLKSLNTFAIDVTARYFSTVTSIDELAEAVNFSRKKSLPRLILGGGSNILFTQNYPGIVIKTDFLGITTATRTNNTILITASASEQWHNFVRHTLNLGYNGLENLSLIPGTVGAAPIQNIGAYGVELADKFHSLTAVDLDANALEPLVFNKNQCNFEYRNSYFKNNPGRYVITDVTFSLPQCYDLKTDYPGIKQQLANRHPEPLLISEAIIQLRQSKLPNPDQLANAGSFFKNPIISNRRLGILEQLHPDIASFPTTPSTVKLSAAWLIDQCGWKGYRQGDAGVSEDHALVLVNYGTATGHEISLLATKIIDSVLEKFEIQLHPEPTIV